jgi:hypothetical protein
MHHPLKVDQATAHPFVAPLVFKHQRAVVASLVVVVVAVVVAVLVVPGMAVVPASGGGSSKQNGNILEGKSRKKAFMIQSVALVVE